MSDLFIIPGAVLSTGISFAFSVISYKKYLQSKEKIKIPHFKPGDDLLKEVQKSANKRLYAAVEGKVEPLGKPLKSTFVPECYGVIRKVTTRGQRNPERDEVPFCLLPRGTEARRLWVRVENPLKAEGDYLQEVYRGVKPEDSSGSVPEHTGKVQSVMTGIGDVVMEQGSDETMVLEPPRDGRKFFLFSGRYESVKKRQERKTLTLMLMSFTWAITGCSVFGTLLYTTLNTQKKKN
ncbi:mitochondrial ubiquitin ligase activator of nfkb 1-like [Hemibagrus wyckioides]|nr:mitochondrial ubiquitin ligase activator of nfkb 1-like [Hemibagrus wyckioides]